MRELHSPCPLSATYLANHKREMLESILKCLHSYIRSWVPLDKISWGTEKSVVAILATSYFCFTDWMQERLNTN